MSKRSDDCYRQVEIATNDLITAMGEFRAAVDAEIFILTGQVRGEQTITKKQAEYQAMETPAVKKAVSDCHWASERIVAFNAAYQAAVTRAKEKQDIRLGLIE